MCVLEATVASANACIGARENFLHVLSEHILKVSSLNRNHEVVNPGSKKVCSNRISPDTSVVFVCLQVLNSGPSRSLDTAVEIALPKILTPYRHRLLQVVDWQVHPVLQQHEQ